MAPSDLALKEALGVMQSHEIVTEPLVRLLAMSKDAGARAYAASAVGRWADRLPEPLEILRPLASDENPRVRLHAIVASTYVESPQSIDIAATAAEKGTDKFLDYSLKQAVFALKSEWLGRVPESGKNPSLRALLLNYGGATELLSHIRDLLQSNTLTPQQARDAWRILIENGDANDILALKTVEDVALRRELLHLAVASVQSRNIPPPRDVGALMNHPALYYENDTFRLLGLWHIEEAERRLIWVAEKISPPRINQPWSPSRTAALVGLVGVNAREAARLARQFEGRIPETDWKEVITAFARRKDGLNILARQFEATPDSIAAKAIVRFLNESGKQNDEVRRVLSVDVPSKPNNLTLADIPGLVREIRSQGDARRGEQILKRPELGCLNCHAVKGQGGTIGPDLGALGTAQPIEFIIGAILDPQKEVKEGYMATSITTKDGDDFQGYEIRETPTEVVLRDIVQNSVVTIQRSRIAQKRQSGSPMPSGLTDAMNRREFVDLVKYLSELGK
jgi:putative heme-binding domain-containing protein